MILVKAADAGGIRSTTTVRLGKINGANLKKAYTQLGSGSTIGKVVLDGF